MKKKVIFICTHNSARSQMAEGLLNGLYGDEYEAHSAGTAPSKVNPYAVQAMAEIDIDISNNRSKSIEEFQNVEFDYVVTVCDHAKETCPVLPGRHQHIHKSFADPSGAKGNYNDKFDAFRSCREEIKAWIQKSLRSLSNGV